MKEISRGVRERGEKLIEAMMKERHAKPDTLEAALIREFGENVMQIETIKAGEETVRDKADKQKLFKIQESLVRSLNRVKKSAAELEAMAENDTEEKAQEKAVKTGANLDPENDYFDLHEAIKAYRADEWAILLKAEKGKHGEAGLKWAKNCRKVHALMYRWDNTINEQAPDPKWAAVRKLRADQGKPAPGFNVAPEELPRD